MKKWEDTWQAYDHFKNELKNNKKNYKKSDIEFMENYIIVANADKRNYKDEKVGNSMSKNSNKKEFKNYSFKDKGAYHTKRAKSGSNATPEQRAYSRGWLTSQKMSQKAYKYNKKKRDSFIGPMPF